MPNTTPAIHPNPQHNTKCGLLKFYPELVLGLFFLLGGVVVSGSGLEEL